MSTDRNFFRKFIKDSLRLQEIFYDIEDVSKQIYCFFLTHILRVVRWRNNKKKEKRYKKKEKKLRELFMLRLTFSSIVL